MEIEKHSALNLTAKQLQAEIAMACMSLMSEAVRQVREASGRISQEASQLQSLYGQIQAHRDQWRRIAWSSAAALVLGILLSPFLARLLPFGLDTRVAALVMHQDRWNAGAQLMEAGNPDSWRSLRIAEQLVRANQAAIEQCQATAMKAKKEQRCSITVAAD